MHCHPQPCRSRNQSQDSRCNFGYASAAISLGTTLFWAFFLGVRKSLIAKDWIIKSGDLVINVFGTLWWLGCAIPLCIWTDQVCA